MASRVVRRSRNALERLARRIALGLPIIGTGADHEDERGDASGRRAVSLARYNRAYFRRWLLIGALIGVVAGVGAILFYSAIAFCSQLFLGWGAGFYPPNPASEGPTILRPIARPWLLPVITTLGGLLTGLIVFTLAPEAEGHGTDAAIEAFHHKNGYIRARIPVIKLVASAITIGSGGSAGREGPTAQISAGFGSWLATLLRLDDHDRRIAMAAGIGSGIGAIFKAPIGGAILSGEILYKRDFEADVLFPSFIASVVGFSIYGAWAGWTPVFGAGGHFTFEHPLNLVGYLILGLCAGGVGLLYPKTLYTVRDFFARLRIPNIFKPAIGGLLVGLIGLLVPQALGMGYGFVQFGVNSDYVHLAAWLMLLLVFVKILTTSLTIGSGGSGGVFGPGMVIGGFLGGALWAGLHTVAPWMVAGTQPGAFVIVGMGAFFGGIAKAPLAVILMVAEMTGEYSLIVPAMLATMAAYLVTGETSIYEKQVPTRLDSPAHRDDYALLLTGAQGALAAERVVSAPERYEQGDPMRRLRVAVAMTLAPRLVSPTLPFNELQELVEEDNAVLVANAQGRAAGIVTQRDVRRCADAQADAHDGSPPAKKLTAKDVATRPLVTAKPDETLQDAVRRMSALGLRQLPVMAKDETGAQRVVGLLRRSDALAAYVTSLADLTAPSGSKEKADGVGGVGGVAALGPERGVAPLGPEGPEHGRDGD
ncbi:MAG: chloride channel protein [Ktedonobacterales bacterium]